jgi:two-component system chemotaxis response regulator CheY
MQKRVLVVEDEGDIQNVLRSILELAECEVQAASDGIAALELLKRMGPPDLIFLDLMMPKMDGVSFVQTLRKQESYKDVPVIVLSGDAHVRERVDALNMDVFIAKPFSVDEILDFVEAFIGEPTQP